ncbi:carboxypeptidase-like regulatory domain-containing protein [Saccharothrix variisporea]|uniref:Carboxypeptidase family protein n=1 Tax=Saccharothrix variisporea TaxID=543527 RepID=A0A495X5S5_9PSEU|nr:carboxypeptidase-like regulatory domain-containing protein [Saccharothrix variisporea]RKT69390.1 carboxypeptidase family protein [Saccharothrix variisporea]
MGRAHPAKTVLLIGLLAFGACGRGETGSSDASTPPSPTTAQATFTGVVLDGGGRPVDGALVQPKSLDHPPQPVPELAVFSGPDGQFAWHLTPGRYEFSATKEGRTGTPSEATAAAGGTERVELRLP